MAVTIWTSMLEKGLKGSLIRKASQGLGIFNELNKSGCQILTSTSEDARLLISLCPIPLFGWPHTRKWKVKLHIQNIRQVSIAVLNKEKRKKREGRQKSQMVCFSILWCYVISELKSEFFPLAIVVPIKHGDGSPRPDKCGHHDFDSIHVIYSKIYMFPF